MQRKIAVVVLCAGAMFAGHFGVMSAAKQAQEQIPTRGEPQQLQGRELADQESARAEQERSNFGLAMAPVPLQAGFGQTRFMVGLGSYLVNTGCISCHSNPAYVTGGNPYMGEPQRLNTTNYLAGGRRFGNFTARNLTPDPKRNNLPAGLTLEEFKRTLRTGEDLKKLHLQTSPLLQVMPWPEIGSLSDHDLEAIYYYLSAIPHADPAPQ